MLSTSGSPSWRSDARATPIGALTPWRMTTPTRRGGDGGAASFPSCQAGRLTTAHGEAGDGCILHGSLTIAADSIYNHLPQRRAGSADSRATAAALQPRAGPASRALCLTASQSPEGRPCPPGPRIRPLFVGRDKEDFTSARWQGVIAAAAQELPVSGLRTMVASLSWVLMMFLGTHPALGDERLPSMKFSSFSAGSPLGPCTSGHR